jgi:hypothetical protein
METAMLVPTRPPFAFARRPARIALAATALALAFCGAAVAQENFTSPPEALQFPFETQANARGELSISIVRQLVEGTVDNILCKRLMRQDGRPIPEPFVCEPAYRQRVAAN